MVQYYKKDDTQKKLVTITDEQETFYRLSDGQMIKKDIFFKYYSPNSVTESSQPNTTTGGDLYMDPSLFFSQSSVLNQEDINKLKGVDPSRVSDIRQPTEIITNTNKPLQNRPNLNESLVKVVDNIQIPNNTNTDVSQYKVYDNEDEAYNDFIKNQPVADKQPNKPQQSIHEIEKLFEDEKMAFGYDEAIKRKDVRLKRSHLSTETTQGFNTEPLPVVNGQNFDASEIMFKTFKRNHPVSITIKFDDKIGNPDFVKMMIENMDGDIVSYYKKIIMNNIINNIKHIEDEVEKCIRVEIFGEQKEQIKKTRRKTKGAQQVETPQERIVEDDPLIEGGQTKTGKQLYKYRDENDKIVELLKETAEKRNLKPYKTE